MANKKPKERKATYEPWESRVRDTAYVRLSYDQAVSPAWRDLSNDAKILLLDMKLREWIKKRSDKKDARRLIYRYADAEEHLAMSQRVFTRSRDELIRNGFLDLVEHWPNSSKNPNVYGFSTRWHDYGKPEFVQSERPKSRPRKRD